jgi:hypothetical protein
VSARGHVPLSGGMANAASEPSYTCWPTCWSSIHGHSHTPAHAAAEPVILRDVLPFRAIDLGVEELRQLLAVEFAAPFGVRLRQPLEGLPADHHETGAALAHLRGLMEAYPRRFKRAEHEIGAELCQRVGRRRTRVFPPRRMAHILPVDALQRIGRAEHVIRRIGLLQGQQRERGFRSEADVGIDEQQVRGARFQEDVGAMVARMRDERIVGEEHRHDGKPALGALRHQVADRDAIGRGAHAAKHGRGDHQLALAQDFERH